MRMTRILSSVAMLLLTAMVWAPVPASAERLLDQAGTINGRLVNRTPGGAGVGNASITLVTYQGETEQGRANTTSDEQGRFQFTGLATSSDYDYGLSVLYQEAEYMSDFRRFTEGSASMDWEVPVYDPTSHPSQIRIGRGHVIINVRTDTLTVLEFLSFVNTGDKTYVGANPITTDGRKETLKLGVPAEANEITAQEGLDECCAFRTAEGISDTLAVPPGGKSIVFSYDLPYKSSEVYLDLPLYYPVDSFNLFVTDQVAKVSSPQLKVQDTVDMGGQKYQHLVGSNLPVATELSIDLTNLGGGNAFSAVLSSNNLRWGGIGAAVVAIGLVLFYGLRSRPSPVATAGVPVSNRPANREVLLRELAELDDRFASGQLADDDYERLREEKKRKLKEIVAAEEDKVEED